MSQFATSKGRKLKMKIAMINQKGGCGKTSTTAILAKALADTGKSVLLIDADPQAGLTSIFMGDVEIKESLFEIIIGKQIEPLKTLVNGIDIIPSDYRLDKVFLSVDQFTLNDGLKDLFKKYDFTIFDTPPTVQGISQAILIISDKVLIPTDISIQSKKPTAYTIEQVNKTQKTPAVILIGYKEKSGTGFNAILNKDFIDSFGSLVKASIPKSTMTAKLAGQHTKTTQAVREKIFSEILKAAL
jgi:cellulose biosynthesis protein BcsQ